MSERRRSPPRPGFRSASTSMRVPRCGSPATTRSVCARRSPGRRPCSSSVSTMPASCSAARQRWRRSRPPGPGPTGSVVVTDGARGAWFFPRDRTSPPCRAVRRSGSRANWGGRRVYRGADRTVARPRLAIPYREDIQFAAAAGALATTRPGALDGLPTRAEIVAFQANAKVQNACHLPLTRQPSSSAASRSAGTPCSS